MQSSAQIHAQQSCDVQHRAQQSGLWPAFPSWLFVQRTAFAVVPVELWQLLLQRLAARSRSASFQLVEKQTIEQQTKLLQLTHVEPQSAPLSFCFAQQQWLLAALASTLLSLRLLHALIELVLQLLLGS